MKDFAEGIKRELLGEEAWKCSKKYTPAGLDSDLRLVPGTDKIRKKSIISEFRRNR